MTQPPLISGLPSSLARDGWWLDDPLTSKPEPPAPSAMGGLPRRAGLVVLVALADLLFWHHAPGLSLAIFAVAIFAVAAFQDRPHPLGWKPMLLLVLAVTPVVEHLQALSAAFLAVGLAGALIWLRNPKAALPDIVPLAPALLRALPVRWFRGLPLRRATLARIVAAPRTNGCLRRMVRDWAFPLGGVLVIAGLLMQANPVLAEILRIDLDLWALLNRGLFWTAAAVFLSALLARKQPDPIALPHIPALSGRWFGLNASSVLRALGVFNLLIAVQTTTDLTILAFGARLPEGMSLAEYAHRGAYPLLATALLAGAFALAARPFLGERRAIRPLLLVWLVQNVILCAAAMMRLDHYIDAFGLTYLRLYALIWMGLVTVGLGLVACQVFLRRKNSWLVLRFVALGLGTLYVSAFINFAQIIAVQNLDQANADIGYICDLGPLAHGALEPSSTASWVLSVKDPQHCTILEAPIVEDWRDWGFRSWRVAHYSAAKVEGEGRVPVERGQ